MKNNKGLTLLEVLLTLAIFGMLSGILSQIFFFSRSAAEFTESKAETEQNLRVAAGWISDRVRSLQNPAKEVSVQGGRLFIGAYRYYLSGHTLLEFKDGRANQLAAGITRFEPAIDEGALYLNMTAQFGGGAKRRLKLTIYIGVNE